MKKLTVLLISFFSIYLIYCLCNINKINYISISDSIMNDYNPLIEKYLSNNNRLDSFNNYFHSPSIIKMYQDIRNNRTIRVNNKDFYLKKVLRESDIVVISVGMEELANNYNKYDMKTNYYFFDDMFNNIERVITEIKKYAYSKIIFIGYYNPSCYYDANVDRFFYDMDIKLSKLMIDNNIIYIDLYEKVKGNNYKEKDCINLNQYANKSIANIIEYYCIN